MSGISAVSGGGLMAMWQQLTQQTGFHGVSGETRRPGDIGAPGESRESASVVERGAARSPVATAVTQPASFPELQLPTEEDLNNAAEWLVRTRIAYPESASGLQGRTAGLELESAEKGTGPAAEAESPRVEKSESPSEVMEEAECETCARRKYQDGSDDPGVSFKSPTQIDPEMAASAVRGHEQEHVVRERAEAQREGRKVVSQSVTIHTAICPECGKVYVSGGVTRTVTAPDDDETSVNPNEKADAENRAGSYGNAHAENRVNPNADTNHANHTHQDLPSEQQRESQTRRFQAIA